jgi:WD40 repeat protein
MDGNYVLAAVKPNAFWSSRPVSIWSIKSGRHRGDLVGSPSNVNGIAILAGGTQLIAGCQDGNIRFWDFAAAMAKIREFERSLGE